MTVPARPEVSVIVPWRDEGDTGLGFEGTQRFWNWEFCRRRWERHVGKLAQHVEFVQADNRAPAFDRGGSRNAGIDATTGDVIVLADADVIPDFELIDQAIAAVRDGGFAWALPYDVYLNVTEEATDLILDRGVPHWTGGVAYDHRITDSVAGILVIDRAKLGDVRYDPRFDGWGYEDNAFAAALDTLAGPHFRVHGHLLHLWHPVAPDGGFNQPRIGRNRALWAKYQRAAGHPDRMRRLLEGAAARV